MVEVPPSIDVSSKKGMATKVWGPKLWDSLFIMILGAYPVVIDENSEKHLKIKNAFIKTLMGLRFTLPCSFCRESLKTFINELPLATYTDSRLKLTYWLYLIKDKVNKKLIKQEEKFFKESGKNDKDCFKTVPSPSFRSVLKKYEKYRAKCDKKTKRCVKQ